MLHNLEKKVVFHKVYKISLLGNVMKKGLLSLSPIERKILPYLSLPIEEICAQTKLDKTTVTHALQFLSRKGIIKLESKIEKEIVLGSNGILYLKEGLPERRLLDLLAATPTISLEEAKAKAELTEKEFQAALGALKRKALLKIISGNILLQANKEEISKKMLEESFLASLPLSLAELKPEQKFCLGQLSKRKDIIRIEEKKLLEIEITAQGKKIISAMEKAGPIVGQIEQLTPEMLKKGTWRGKKFRVYDVTSSVPLIIGGKRQPYAEFLQHVREKLVTLGFEEMQGSLVENEFWNYDALFQPQFHVAREWSSTYYIKNKLKQEKIPRKIMQRVKKQHEKSWRYKWNPEQAMKLILRPQGTVLSARQIASNLSKLKIPGKYFAITRCYRPDVVDATHLSEFNQVEGIIVKENLTLRNLFAILELFGKEIAQAKKVEIRPSYFPFTEPSAELFVKHKKFGWIELGGAGIFRREVVKPLTGKDITVLAWGLGIDRLAMLNLKIKDIRQLFSHDLDWLRKSKKT